MYKMECTVVNNKMVPLTKAVHASIIDVYGDIGRTEERHSHWAARELRQIYMQSLPKIKHKVWLTVNVNTHTATLPLDYWDVAWVGFVDSRWHKVPLKLNNRITDSKNIIDIPCEDKCPKCNQDTSICNDLVVTEETEFVAINNIIYEKTIVKKLYPNGDYFLETTTPCYDVVEDEVTYFTKKEFIVNFDLKPCGCLEDSALNTANLITYCPDIYCNHFAPCDTQCNTSFGGYKIFEETGLIQMDYNYPFDKVYIEYYGFITKIKGQYYVPYVAFETIVEGVKYRSIKDRKNVLRWQVLDQKESYREAKGNMSRILGRASLAYIIQAASMVPKFNLDYGENWYSCFNSSSEAESLLASVTTINSSGQCCINGGTTIINRTAFTLNVKVDGNPGHPVAGETTYQNNVLKGATDLVWIFAAKAVETILDGDFTFDPVTGIIDRSPNQWFTGDTLIATYNKIV